MTNCKNPALSNAFINETFDGQSAHYCAGGIETIDVIEAYALNFALGNAVKYILRCGRKGTAQDAIRDLEKAQAYIGHEIDRRRAALAEASKSTGEDETRGLTNLARRECDY